MCSDTAEIRHPYLFVHKNTRNMLQHVILVTSKIFERIEGEGGKEIWGDRTMLSDVRLW